MMFKNKCKASTWDRIIPCNSSTRLALSGKHSYKKMPGDAGGQVEQESAICPSSGEGMTYEKTHSCVCSGPLKKEKRRNNCCTQLHMDGYRENGTRGFLEVHSKGQLTQKSEREICLDVRKENLSSEGGQRLEKGQREAQSLSLEVSVTTGHSPEKPGLTLKSAHVCLR